MASFTSDEYAEWVQSSLGMQLDPRLEIFEQSTEDGQVERGIRTNFAVSPQSTLVIIPFTSLLSIASAAEDPAFDAVRERLREDDLMVLLILREKHKGKESRWSRHFEYIPTTYHSVINYTEDELEFLKGSNLYDLTYRWHDQLKSDFQELLLTLQDIHFPQTELLGRELDYATYLWCLSTIWSRCLTVERGDRDYRCIVPFLDLLNHNPASGIGHAYHATTDSLFLATSQALEPGQELCLHYGPSPNSRLLMLYGFALSYNPYDVVELWASMEDEGDTVSLAEKRCILEKCSIPFDRQPFLFTLSETTTESEEGLLAFLRLQHLSPDVIHELATMENPRDRLFQLFDDENEVEALRGAVAAVKGMLDLYPTTLIDDLKRLKVLTTSLELSFVHPKHRELHALYVIIGEKRLLHKALKRYDLRLQEVMKRVSKVAQGSA